MLRHATNAAFLLCCGLLVAACGDDLGCSTSGATELVKQIAAGELEKAGLGGKNGPVKLSISDIITSSNQTAQSRCKAKLTLTVVGPNAPNGLSRDMSITYTVEKTDDGRLYVTVFGL